jgi:hypothetical protein
VDGADDSDDLADGGVRLHGLDASRKYILARSGGVTQSLERQRSTTAPSRRAS